MHKVVDDSHLHSMIDLYYYCIRNDRLVRRVSYKKQELLTIHDQLDRPLIFDGVCGAHPFRFLCCVFVFCLSSFCVLCALFVIILCLVCFVCHHSVSCVLCLSSFCVLCVLFVIILCLVCFVCHHSVSCVLNVPSVSVMSILYWPFGFL
jgi:hypothetical protein